MSEKKYLISWDAGYGTMYDVVKAESHDEAMEDAYQSWREAAESQAEYNAEELTPELAEEHGFEEHIK